MPKPTPQISRPSADPRTNARAIPRRRTNRPRAPRIRSEPLARRPRGIRMAKIYTPPLGAELAEGTLPEKMVESWLRRNADKLGIGWRKQQKELGFELRTPGSALVDFEITYPYRMMWRVQGLYWHRKNAGVLARDQRQYAELSRYGQVIDLWESEVYIDVDSVCRDALRGIQHPEPESGFIPYRPPGM